MVVNKNSENYTFLDTLDGQLLEGNINILLNGSFDMNFHLGEYDFVSYGRNMEGNYFLNVIYGRNSTLMTNIMEILNTILEEVGYEEPQYEEEQTPEEPEVQN